MGCDASALLQRLMAQAAQTSDPDALGRTLVETIREQAAQATWVGIYWLEGDTLVLGPYVGPPTEHTRIPVGRGVCGTAVAENRDIVVEDVRKVENYLACSASTRSELVVLIQCQGRVVGQIDLDSDRVGAFSELDRCVLRAAADAFGGILSLTTSGRFERPAAPPEAPTAPA